MHTTTTSTGGSQTLGHSPPALTTSSQVKTCRVSPFAEFQQSLLKLFKLADPEPAHPASPVSSYRHHSEVSCPFPCLLTNPSASPCVSAWTAVFSGSCENSKTVKLFLISFPGSASFPRTVNYTLQKIFKNKKERI